MKVSVILPTYNEAGNITRLVDAILAIMPEEIEPEIIVVDDNSTDGTLQLVRDRFGDDNRVIALLRTTDRGLAKSVRAGIERSQVQDNLGGYFTIQRSVLQDIPFDTVFQGHGEYYFRLLYHLQRQERSLVEIPAVYLARTAGQSKSRFLTMLVRYSWAAIELRRTVPPFKKVSS